MVDRSIEIGLISVAHSHAFSYVHCLRQLPGVSIAGLWDDNSRRGADAARQLALPFYEDVNSLLKQKLDGVIICSENANHRRHVELCAGHTPNILCEKPIASTVEDGQAIIDLCAEAGCRLQIAFPVRFAPAVARLKTRLDQGDLGRILAVQSTNHGTIQSDWFIKPELSGGGAVIDHTVHVIDVLRWYWQTDVTEVYAEIGYGLLRPDLSIDDSGLLSFQLANGIYGTLDTSWSRHPSAPAQGDVKIEVVGEQGIGIVDISQQSLLVSASRWGKSRRISYGSSMDRGLIHDFVDMIRTQRPPSITGEDGLRALEVAVAAYASAARGAPVRI